MAIPALSRKTVAWLAELLAAGASDEFARNSLLASYPDLEPDTVATYLRVARARTIREVHGREPSLLRMRGVDFARFLKRS